MAAEVIARELGLDLYTIDLSQVVSKYIGETEKNLDRIFTAAESANAILFFDEADALFGKRSEVRDSHVRYANIEISYLVQKMEEYQGISILATNLRQHLDAAFLRRLQAIVELPFPATADWERSWRVTFPREVPLSGDVDFATLVRALPLAGGSIKNIALSATFFAAAGAGCVQMPHLAAAAAASTRSWAAPGPSRDGPAHRRRRHDRRPQAHPAGDPRRRGPERQPNDLLAANLVFERPDDSF